MDDFDYFDPPFVGSSSAACRVKKMIRQLANARATVLVTGESGVGKEVVARNLHNCSERQLSPFVSVNCAALNPGVLESELFGHGKGSFTGAIRSHAGLFEQAHCGTIFLDEIGEVPTATQAKLLRVLQDREVRPMGGTTTRQVDVRIISATNSDLDQKVRDKTFRMDLYYRLMVVEIRIPPLRERPADIPELIEYFCRTRSHPNPEVPEETLRLLSRYEWPGNVRELENEIERLFAFHPRTTAILPSMLSDRIVEGRRSQPLDVHLLYGTPLPQAVGYLEENLLRKSLRQTNWNKSQSARKLGLSRQGLIKKIKRYGISPNDPVAEPKESSPT